MTDDIDDAVDELADVQAGSDLESVPIVGVAETNATVSVTLGLPSGNEFVDEFTKPPVWGANCELQSFLDAMGVGPDELDELVGRTVAAEREVGTSGLEFSIDREAVFGGK
ncbi:hypothetical protein [Haloarchaeobius iranensis]|uniref:Uncharacterized protein n=1 Tax=Haloarchaeobius iranensis TaxID=996166 RepID=A0A1H0AXG4_9EURY|nr:hypothetical protein [Haloarchaeobius iranensis]SDN38105.1 hypothetical protein SAMN05192554_13110 [Haloarchaeobius iranensis]